MYSLHDVFDFDEVTSGQQDFNVKTERGWNSMKNLQFWVLGLVHSLNLYGCLNIQVMNLCDICANC